MKTTVTIAPATIQHYAHVAFYRAMARSHKNTCDSKLYFIFNEIYTDEHKAMAERFTRELTDLDYGWVYYEGDFHLNKLFNCGLDNTESEYVVYSIADTLFLGDWLTPLQKLIDTGEYHSVQGTSRENYDGFYSYRDLAAEEPGKVLKTQGPCGYHFLMRRDQGYRWDEEVGLFYPDVLYREYLLATNQFAGIYADSHVEHLGAPISYLRTHYGETWTDRELRERNLIESWRAEDWATMKKKWLQ